MPSPNAEKRSDSIEVLLRLAARQCGAAIQLCVLQGHRRGSVTTDARAPDLSALARRAAAEGRFCWDVVAQGGTGGNALAVPIFETETETETALGAICAYAPQNPNVAETVLADIAFLLARECAASADALSGADVEIPQALLEVMDGAPLAMALYDVDLVILKVNARWGFDFGLDPDRMVGRTLYEIDPATTGWETQYRNCLRGERLVSDRAPIQLKDGRTAFLSAITIPWRRSDGEVGGLLGMYRMSAKNSADEYALGEAQRRLEAAVRLGGIHVWELNYRTRSIWTLGDDELASDRVSGFFDHEQDLAAGVHAESYEAVAAAMAQARAKRQPYIGEYRVDRAGAELWVSAASADVYGEDGALETRLGVLLDITPRKRAEQAQVRAVAEAEAANRAKSEFLATMSHEIRTPLNGVLGMARAMAAEELSPRQRERLEVVRQSGETLLGLLNDVLDLSKVEAGKLVLEQAAFNIVELARAACSTFEGVAADKGLTFDLVVSETAAGRYVGDAARVRQVLANLVSNALKFTEKGGVVVRVERSRRGLAIRVRDSGIGLSREQQSRLFRKFEQADASTTRRFGGTGLGLAICRELVGLMKGRLSVVSKPGEGATFTVTLPLAKLADGDAGLVETTIPPTRSVGAEGEPLRVLAAEDNKVNQLVLRTLLNQAGIEPTIVDDGRAALEMWENQVWDVILMDVQMPLMDGPTSARAIRLRERETGRAPTPIIALTANVMSHQLREYEDAGMGRCVAKPIEIAALFAALEAALSDGEPATAPAGHVSGVC